MNDKELFETLSYKPKHANENFCEEFKNEAYEYCEGYKTFLSLGKTEREACALAKEIAKENGFVPLCSIDELKPGDKVYAVNSQKAVLLAVIGTCGIEDGINLIGSHIDSPRMDLKQRPLFEDENMAWLKTQYYGGIKKYQWLALPLAMHGTICKADGTSVDVCIGENAGDPVFTITDLLPHLSQEQMQKQLSKAFDADNFHVFIGSLPKGDDDIKEKVKFNILSILFEKYGIAEEDFISAEIEFVPAFGAHDVGLDRSFVGSYGQDDRVCAYASLKGIVDACIKGVPKKTAVCLLVDKEEVGSMGHTGMKSRFFELTLSDIITKLKGGCDAHALNRVLSNSDCLSADVGAAYDPQYPSVHDKKNAAFAGCGVLISKYTGGRGKSDSSDADAEFVAKVRKIFNDAKILWQSGELGKVDVGGGGTIAQYVANLGLNVLDCGTPILCMHAPFELASKFDCFMTYKAYRTFYEA